MYPHAALLINAPHVETWPAWLLRARRSADARLLARAHYVLRRKSDGCYLAAVLSHHRPAGLLPGWNLQAGVNQALKQLGMAAASSPLRRATLPPLTLPLDQLHHQLNALALDGASYAARSGLKPIAEPAFLQLTGRDRFSRPLWLVPQASRAWYAMTRAAAAAGVMLEALSGYRSHIYQLNLFFRKLGAGQALAQVLTVNAAPGFSEHHSGRALDIGTPGEPPTEESFEATPAFTWLQANAKRFSFRLSYPRNNPHGIIYEPWHWCFVDHQCAA